MEIEVVGLLENKSEMKKKMKIFVAMFEEHAHNDGNPFVSTLEDAISAKHDGVEFCSVKERFWKEDDWDIVHIMWPDCFAPYVQEGYDLRKRLQELKAKGVKLMATVHNLTSNFEDEYKRMCYDIVYPEVEIMIHLWTYSKEVMEQQYPSCKHVIIPHHVYDTYYTKPLLTKNEALKYFHYRDGVYALAFGWFRNGNERNLILEAAKSCPDIKFLAPRFLDIPHGTIDKRWIKQRLKWVYYRIFYPNLYLSGKKFITDEELPMYYAIADISFIQRVEILNSGNVPLGMLMGKVIVGPNLGNVGAVLKDTANCVFDPTDKESVKKALRDALKFVHENKGAKNREYALQEWNTERVAELQYAVYESCMEKKSNSI